MNETPCLQSYIAKYIRWQRKWNKTMSKYVDYLTAEYEYMIGRPVVYVKNCGDFELYERKSKVRGARINGVNYDMTVLFLSQNREPEIHEFFINSDAYKNEPEWEEKDGEMIRK